MQLVEAQWIIPDVSDQRPEQKKLNLVQTWSTESFGMDIHVWNKLETLLRAEGCEDIVVESFDLGYGAEAKRPEDRNVSAELWVESFRHLASKITGEWELHQLRLLFVLSFSKIRPTRTNSKC